MASTHISRKPMASRPMYMNSLMTANHSTPAGDQEKKHQFQRFACDDEFVFLLHVFVFLLKNEIAPTLCLSWCQFNKVATFFHLIVT